MPGFFSARWDGFEFSAGGIEQFELAVGDAEPHADERKRSSLDPLGDKRKCHQPFERQLDSLAFEIRLVAVVTFFGRRFEQPDP
jgi:hypothetical protein